MTAYIPSPSAESMSDALWALARPAQVRGVKDTQYLFGWITDLQGARWLVVDTEYEITVHAAAVIGEIAVILQSYVDAGSLTADELVALGDFITSKRGERIVVYDSFPQFLKDQSKTYAQMIDAGLLASPVP